MMHDGGTAPKVFKRPVQFDGVIANMADTSISFGDVVKRYDVTAEQPQVDMKELRWRKVDGTYYFSLKQIRARYQVDTDKLRVLADLQAAGR